MKISDLKPCINCGGPLTGKSDRNVNFYTVEVANQIINNRLLEMFLRK